MVDLLAVAKSLDPRFADNMPQEVADAFANNQVQRIFRTSSSMVSSRAASIGQLADEFGDYGESIYVQTKDGRTARFKNPELSMQRMSDPGIDAGWNAKTYGVAGESAFFEKAAVIDTDKISFDPQSIERKSFDQWKKANPKAGESAIYTGMAKHNDKAITPITASSDSIIGKNIIEYGSTRLKDGSDLSHLGHKISDVYDISGERTFFPPNPLDPKLRSTTSSVESIDDFMVRRGLPTTSTSTAVKTAATTATETATKTAPKSGVDMLEVAKKLIPDIEDNMPAAVREAFDAGKVKAIFRTGGEDVNPETGMRYRVGGTMRQPSSTYFLLDDGRAARHGFDDTNAAYKGKGRGWMGARASVPKVIPTQDDPFVFDRILFGGATEELGIGSDVEKVLKSGSGITSDPVVGKFIHETFSEDGKVIKSHGGNAVKDIYRRDGTATFYEDAADPIYDKKISPTTAAIDDLDFVEKQAKNSKVKIPKLKSAGPAEAAPAPTTARIDSTPPPSGSTMKPVGTEVPADEVTRSVKPRAVSESRLRGLIEHAKGTGPEAENAKKMLAKLGYQDVAAAEKGLAAMEAHARVAAEGAQATSEATIDDAVKGGAKIASDPPAAGAKVTTTAAGAGGAKPPTPSAKTATKLADSLDLAKKAVKGHTNARNLLIAGAASIVGAGAYMRNRKNNNIETEYEQY